jgi:hypothetical protein
LLEKEVSLFPKWLLWHALISPQLELHGVEVKPLGDDTYRVRAVVQNAGWLPTYVTKHAAEKKIVRGVVVELDLPAGVTLETGKAREEIGQLEGRAYKGPALSVWNEDPTTDRLKVEWTVKAPKGTQLQLTARHERARTVRREIVLG